MSVLYIALPIALLLAAAAIWGFYWALRSGQLDDLETPAWRVLIDDSEAKPNKASGSPTTKQDRDES